MNRPDVSAAPPGLNDEHRRALDDARDQARQHAARPSEDRAAAAADVTRRAIVAEETIRENDLNGWTCVHDAADGLDDPAVGDR